MADLEPGTRVKTYRTDRDTLGEYWDTLGVVRWRDHSDEYESYLVTWDCGSYETSMMRDEFEVLTEDEARLALAKEVMRT
jgi:hypothetical protein